MTRRQRVLRSDATYAVRIPATGKANHRSSGQAKDPEHFDLGQDVDHREHAPGSATLKQGFAGVDAPASYSLSLSSVRTERRTSVCMNTQFPSKGEIVRQWHVVDADGAVLAPI